MPDLARVREAAVANARQGLETLIPEQARSYIIRRGVDPVSTTRLALRP